jgi:hypothetical protein
MFQPSIPAKSGTGNDAVKLRPCHTLRLCASA